MTVPLTSGHARPPAGPGARSRRRTRAAEPVSYNFRRPPIQLSREHARVLHVAFDTYARAATSVFTSTLHSLCQVSLVSVGQASYGEYVDALESPTCMAIISADPIHGAGALELPLGAAMTSIDLMLGGQGGADQPVRPLTEIESAVLRVLLDRLLAELRMAMRPLTPALDPVVTDVEYNPMFAQVAGPADVMVIITFELHLGDPVHRMTLALPYSGLLPHLVKATARTPLSEREHAQRERAAEQLQEQLQHVPLDVTVRFHPVCMTPTEVSGLQPGDIVRLPHPASVPLDITVDGTTFAHATAGTQGQRLAARVVSLPEKES